MRLILFLVFNLICLFARGQEFSFESSLEKVDSTGFYKISLRPSLISNLNKNKTDLRLYDQNNIEVPFILEIKRSEPTSENNRVNGYTTSYRENRKRKTTEIELEFHTPQSFSLIEFDIEGPIFYKRNMIIKYEDYPLLKRKASKSERNIKYLELSSDTIAKLDVGEAKAEKLLFIVENKDNPPLQIKSIRIFQRNHYLVAFLEKDHNYVLKYGIENLEAPQYDLSYFRSRVSQNLPEVRVDPPVHLNQEPNSSKQAFYEEKGFLWALLGLIIVILATLSIKMVRDLEKKKHKV